MGIYFFVSIRNGDKTENLDIIYATLVIKYTLIIAIGRPVLTIGMVVGVVLVYTLFDSLPGLLPFFGASLMSCVLMWIASFSLPNLEEANDFHF